MIEARHILHVVRRPGRTGGSALALVVSACLLAAPHLGAEGRTDAGVVPTGQRAEDADGAFLLSRVRESLRRERELLLEYVYRERRRPIKVSPLGKVSIGDELVFDVSPSGDPDRPTRTLVAVNGRAPTEAERDEHSRPRRSATAQSAEDRRRREESRRRAQERFEDAFRVYHFEPLGFETLDGIACRLVRVTPRPGTETRSDFGKWLKRFRGHAWVSVEQAELVKLELIATDTISLGWGVVARISEGTKVIYVRRPAVDGRWLPAMARFEAHGRTLLFRSFNVDMTTEWFDYRTVDQSADLARLP